MAAPAPLKAALDERTGEIVEDEALRAEGLKQLRAAVAAHAAKHPKFQLVRDDNQFLLPFLRARKYEVDRALKVLISFCEFWFGSPSIVNGLCGAKVRATYELGYMTLLWGPNEEDRVTDDMGNSVSLLEISKLDYSKVNSEDMARLSLYTLLPLFEDERMSRRGLTILESFEGFTMAGALLVSKKAREPDQQKMMAIGLDTFPSAFVRRRGMRRGVREARAARVTPLTSRRPPPRRAASPQCASAGSSSSSSRRGSPSSGQ